MGRLGQIPQAEREHDDHWLWITGITGLRRAMQHPKLGLRVHKGRDKAQEGFVLWFIGPRLRKVPISISDT
jgi:hypothetical protein